MQNKPSWKKCRLALARSCVKAEQYEQGIAVCTTVLSEFDPVNMAYAYAHMGLAYQAVEKVHGKRDPEAFANNEARFLLLRPYN